MICFFYLLNDNPHIVPFQGTMCGLSLFVNLLIAQFQPGGYVSVCGF